jgi:hypothetical protein
MDEQMKACPFCGSSASMFLGVVHCDNKSRCGAQLTVDGRIDSARAAWNRRASPSPEGTRERGEMRKRIIDVLDKWHDGSRERKADDIVAALTLPPIPGVDREVVARIIRELNELSALEGSWYADVGRKTGERCCSVMRQAASILALVSPLEGKGEGSSCTETAARGTTASRPDRPCQSEWRDIGSAPNNTDHMRPILAYWTGRGVQQTYWDVDEDFADRPPSWRSPECGWRCDGDQCIPVNQDDVTHWMPLPEAPSLPDTSCKSEGE